MNNDDAILGNIIRRQRTLLKSDDELVRIQQQVLTQISDLNAKGSQLPDAVRTLPVDAFQRLSALDYSHDSERMGSHTAKTLVPNSHRNRMLLDYKAILERYGLFFFLVAILSVEISTLIFSTTRTITAVRQEDLQQARAFQREREKTQREIVDLQNALKDNENALEQTQTALKRTEDALSASRPAPAPTPQTTDQNTRSTISRQTKTEAETFNDDLISIAAIKQSIRQNDLEYLSVAHALADNRRQLAIESLVEASRKTGRPLDQAAVALETLEKYMPPDVQKSRPQDDPINSNTPSNSVEASRRIFILNNELIAAQNTLTNAQKQLSAAQASLVAKRNEMKKN